jgi:hypothetical protein
MPAGVTRNPLMSGVGVSVGRGASKGAGGRGASKGAGGTCPGPGPCTPGPQSGNCTYQACKACCIKFQAERAGTCPVGTETATQAGAATSGCKAAQHATATGVHGGWWWQGGCLIIAAPPSLISRKCTCSAHGGWWWQGGCRIIAAPPSLISRNCTCSVTGTAVARAARHSTGSGYLAGCS